ncbi:MAG: OB-fold nucleic acid binding domain-containing protein [Halobacteriales archaeon]
MGSCIICGKDVDGHICESHEQDVYFIFEGNSPDQLTPDRFYQGTVDGYADFGVFVNIGDSVTGLLHRSELDRRLESLDWEAGDEVFVRVKSVRDNGNVDLGWSIRQETRAFRGGLVDTPSGNELLDDEATTSTETGEDEPADATPEPSVDNDTATPTPSPAESPVGESDTESSQGSSGAEQFPEADRQPTPEAASESRSDTEPEPEPESEPEPETTTTETPAEPAATPGGSIEATTDTTPSTTRSHSGDGGGAAVAEPEPSLDSVERVTIDSLTDRVGDQIRIEGQVIDIRQTSGPTVFEIRDESGTVECAAFKSAGVRAYPEVEVGDAVGLLGEVEKRRGNLQIETEQLEVLDEEATQAVEQRHKEALADRARPSAVELLGDHPGTAAVEEPIVEAATLLRAAVIESRPIVVRHSATTDGYVAGAALERAILPLIREEHEASDAEYHYFNRRPLEGRIYDMGDATQDTTSMLRAAERHNEATPLFVFVNAGATEESRDGFDLLDVYGADRIVVESDYPDESMADTANVFVSPFLAGESEAAETVSTSALSANIAAHVNPAVRDDLRHLPAISYWNETPDTYATLAHDAGYDPDEIEALRKALAIDAFYQSYEDKRELIEDILFGDNPDVAKYASEQFQERVDRELRTAASHIETHAANGVTIGMLDTEQFTHQYEFPPTPVLAAALFDHVDDVDAIVCIDADELVVQSNRPVDMRTVGDRIAAEVPDAGVETRGGRDGAVLFLQGGRDAVVEAAIDAVTNTIE